MFSSGQVWTPEMGKVEPNREVDHRMAFHAGRSRSYRRMHTFVQQHYRQRNLLELSQWSPKELGFSDVFNSSAEPHILEGLIAAKKDWTDRRVPSTMAYVSESDSSLLPTCHGNQQHKQPSPPYAAPLWYRLICLSTVGQIRSKRSNPAEDPPLSGIPMPSRGRGLHT